VFRQSDRASKVRQFEGQCSDIVIWPPKSDSLKDSVQTNGRASQVRQVEGQCSDKVVGPPKSDRLKDSVQTKW